MKSFIQKIKSTLRNKKTECNQAEVIEEPINANWYNPDINREETQVFLMSKEIGVFLIRPSETKSNCFVLSIKVAKYINVNEVSHYLIVKSASGFTLKGFLKEFSDLSSLVTHCSIVRDMLPVLLNLRFYTVQSNPIVESHNKCGNYMFFSSSTSSLTSTCSTSSFSSNFSC